MVVAAPAVDANVQQQMILRFAQQSGMNIDFSKL
jgi:hypothetical protein